MNSKLTDVDRFVDGVYDHRSTPLLAFNISEHVALQHPNWAAEIFWNSSSIGHYLMSRRLQRKKTPRRVPSVSKTR